MKYDPNENLKTAVIWRLALLLPFSLVWLDSKYEIIIFAYSSPNYAMFILAMLIPFLLLWFCLTLPRTWMKVIGVVCLSPLTLVAGLWGGLATISLPLTVLTGATPLLSKDKTIETPYWNLTYYHGDGYVIVSQEKEIVPGILVSREIYHTGGPDPIIEILDDYTIKVVSQPGMPEQGIGEYRLNRFVYF